MRFTKRVGKTIARGRITVPKEYDSIFDDSKYCTLGNSVDITYHLKRGTQLYGRLYQSSNNTTTYYQFYITDPRDEEIFNAEIKNEKKISIHFDLAAKSLHISPVN